MLPVPDAFNCTVTFWQSAVGSVTSRTVIAAVQVAVLPLTSVTVRVTVFGPATFAQVNALLFRLKLAMPQASVEPLFTWAAVMLAVPAAFKFTVTG